MADENAVDNVDGGEGNGGEGNGGDGEVGGDEELASLKETLAAKKAELEKVSSMLPVVQDRVSDAFVVDWNKGLMAADFRSSLDNKVLELEREIAQLEKEIAQYSIDRDFNDWAAETGLDNQFQFD